MSYVSGSSAGTQHGAVWFRGAEAECDRCRCQAVVIWCEAGWRYGTPSRQRQQSGWVTDCRTGVYRWCQSSRESAEHIRRCDWVSYCILHMLSSCSHRFKSFSLRHISWQWTAYNNVHDRRNKITWLLSVLWHCRLGIGKSMQFVKIEWWGAAMVTYVEQGASDLHMVQLMPLSPHHLLLY